MNLGNLFYKKKNGSLFMVCVVVVSTLTGCGFHETGIDLSKADIVQDNSVVEMAQPRSETGDSVSKDTAATQSLKNEENVTTTEQRTTENMLKLYVNDEEKQVTWEENESVEVLRNLAANSPVIVDMSMYGGFEQVGYIGQSLPRNDKQMTTCAGDIVLYSGNQLVVFYGSNSWAYTKRGHIENTSTEELERVLGSGDVTITISVTE